MMKSSAAGKNGTPSSVCTVTLREKSFSSTVTLATVIFVFIFVFIVVERKDRKAGKGKKGVRCGVWK
jgi:hypothetical protein